MNYNTEVTLNPIYQNSDFEIIPINNDINLNLELTDFDIAVSIGGNPGEAATVEVGIVSTVDFNTPASVTNSGTPYNAIFDFGIPRGRSCYLYVAYASDDIGTDFTMTFDEALDYIAILESNTEILNPIVSDFSGLWKNYKGAQGEPSMPTTIVTEIPTGDIDGVNTDFTLTHTPISQDAVFFLVNGICRTITLSGNICTLGFAPAIGSVIKVTYFKYIDVLNITVSDITNLGTAATKDIEDFVTRELNPFFNTSTNEIDFNCQNNIQYDTNEGDDDVTLVFSNLPDYSVEKLLIINNERGAAFDLILPTVDIVDGGITYSFKHMIESPLGISNGGSGELNMMFIFKSSTVCEIRITGGASV